MFLFIAFVQMLLSILFLMILNSNEVNADSNKSLRYTRYDMEKMLKHKNNVKYQMPKFSADKIKNIPSANDNFDIGHYGQPLDVWDSWPVKDKDGNVANIHGYHVVFALSGNPGIQNGLSGKICVYYQKISDYKKGVDSWHYAGPLFNSKMEGAVDVNDSTLQHETGEWSGSSIVQSNGKIRLVYTSFSGGENLGGYGDNRQTLTTAEISLIKTSSGLTVDHNSIKDRKPIFEGDGKYYETVEESTDKTGFSHDDHTLRDPQIFEYKGHKYIIFEGNTSKDSGPSGIQSLNNTSYYGGSKKFQKEQRKLINQNPPLKTFNGLTEGLKQSASDDNGCLGLIELNNNYTVKRIFPPLVTFNLVDDETERPSIVMHDNKWYVFTAMHGWHMASTDVGTNDSFMLGFVSNNLEGGYKPLNKWGLVAYSKQNIKSRTYTYSYSMNQNVNNPYLLTSYISQLGNNVNGWHSTFAPSVKVQINGEYTKIQKKVLQQGQVFYK